MRTDIDLKKVYAFDYETELMGVKKLAPSSVCFSIADKSNGGYLISDGDSNYQEYIRSLFEYAYEDEQVILVAHNAKFDLHVFSEENPDMYDKLCTLLDRNQIVDTILVEKLLNLTTTGRITSSLPKNPYDKKEKGSRLEYSLADLVKKYKGLDIKMDKVAADSVRKRYIEMKGTPSSHYPREFKDYSIDDSIHTLDILSDQLEKRNHIIENSNFDPLKTLGYRVALDFHLYEYSMNGVSTNLEAIEKVQKMLEEELSFEKLNLLYPEYQLEGDDWNDHEKVELYLKRDREKGFLKPSYPKHPAFTWVHKKGCKKEKDEFGIPTCGEGCFRRTTRAHTDECKSNTMSKKQCKFTKKWLCDCPTKMKQFEKFVKSGKEYVLDEDGKKIPRFVDSINNQKLKNHIIDLWIERPDDFDLTFTDSAYDEDTGGFLDPELGAVEAIKSTNNQEITDLAKKAVRRNWSLIGVDSEWLDVYAFKDPILEQFAHRAGLIKLQTTEIPRMTERSTGKVSDIVHFNFDVLKETGRTSGFASGLYPSGNGQNIHRMVRSCYKAREGHWILAVDYNSLEFVATAQRTYDRLGESVYKKIFDNGWDAHAYLAAQRAYRSESWFADHCDNLDISAHDHENIYHQFYLFSKDDKQIGLLDKKDIDGNQLPRMFYGHYRNSAKPIGLGKLGGMGPRMIAHVSGATYKIEMTEEEAREYDEIWQEIFAPEAHMLKLITKEHKDPIFSFKDNSRFKYETPMGLVRPNCTFTACANGSLLQSPSAEGATKSVIRIARATKSPTSKSILKGNYIPWDFVHDENVGDVIANPKIATEVAGEVTKHMEDSLREICPDIKNKAEATMMLEWSKSAKELRNKDGHLIPWECKNNKELGERYGYEKSRN